MRISTSQYYESSAYNFQRLQSQLNETQNKLASNSRILNYSDNVMDSSHVNLLEQHKNNFEGYKKNIQSAIAVNNQVASVLDNVNESLIHIKELGLQANNGSLSSSSKAQISSELTGLLDQLQSTLNSKNSEGNYLFSGFNSTNAPFIKIQGGYQYVGSQDKKMIRIDDNTSVASSESGYDLFEKIPSDAGNLSILNTVNQLNQAIAQNSVSAVNDNLLHLDQIIDHLASASATVGSRLSYLDSVSSFQDALSSSLQESISNLKDLDISSAATELNLQSVALEAAQASFAKISQLSVFNFLK